jgi:hypothetical protein
LSLEEKKRLAAEQEQQRSQRTKSPSNSAFNTDDFDLFGFKKSSVPGNVNKAPSLDIFDPYSNNGNQKAQQSSNLFAVNNTFGALPLPPSTSNPVNRSTIGSTQKPDPFDNLFSLKNVVQNSNNPPVSKKNDPLDFLN